MIVRARVRSTWSRYPKPRIDVISSPSGRMRLRRRETCTRTLLGSPSPSQIWSNSSCVGHAAVERRDEQLGEPLVDRREEHALAPERRARRTRRGSERRGAAGPARREPPSRARTSMSSAGSRIQSARQPSSCGRRDARLDQQQMRPVRAGRAARRRRAAPATGPRRHRRGPAPKSAHHPCDVTTRFPSQELVSVTFPDRPEPARAAR